MTEQVLISITLLLAIFIVRLIYGYRQRQQEKQQIKLGLILLGHIQHVIELIQKHRGLSNAMYLSGDQFDKQLPDIQNQLDVLNMQGQSHALYPFEQWQSFVEHWPRLRAATKEVRLTATQSMRQHNAMIGTQLYLIDEVGHFYGLHKIKLDRMKHMLGLCLDTLRTAESIAKARGIGTGLCGEHGQYRADVITLSFIKEDLAVSSDNLFEELLLVDNKELNSYFEQSSKRIGESIKALINMIDEKVLNPKQAVDTQVYFKLATVPITQLSDVFQTIIKHVANQYEIKS